jgi:hypothetical protein
MDDKIFRAPLKWILLIFLGIATFNIRKCDGLEIKQEMSFLELSDYVTLAVAVPETHADAVREAMVRAGAGKVGNYSCCSYSVKGIGRYRPDKGSNPYLGNEGILEEVVEERIEMICNRSGLEHVLEEIKKAHPYEEMVIDIFPIYEMGMKKAKDEIS